MGKTTLLRLLERHIDSPDHRLVLLAPKESDVPSFFGNVPRDTGLHDELLREVQRLRASVYLEDGAITRSQLSRAGLHETPEDVRAWHLLVLRRSGVSACVWYLEHERPRSIDELRVGSSPLARSESWGPALRRAVKGEFVRARKAGLRYSEIGGWAVSRESRNSGEGLLLALATYSLGRAFGGAVGLTTATSRHASSDILRRLGGEGLEADGRVVPPYYDPRYDCEMQILRFDSRMPNGKYSSVIDHISDRLSSTPVVARACETATELSPVTEPMQWQPWAATGGAAA